MAVRLFISLLWLSYSPFLAASSLQELAILHEDQYPKALFFRSSEKIGKSNSSTLSYKSWDKDYSQLMGMVGKVLNNELPTITARGSEAFKRFKAEHPGQLVLNHYNGNARDPLHERDIYFDGHWLYYNGAKITQSVPANTGKTEIAVQDPLLFKVNIGLYGDANEDIGLCMLDENGKPDWSRAEQVKLLSVNVKKKTITVLRGQYGTTPLSFPANGAYAAAHMYTGPWAKKANLLWRYNHSIDSPRDKNGKRAIDVRVDEIKRQFSPSGRLHGFDGLEFDVLLHTPEKEIEPRGADCDADGIVDHCVIEGQQVYGQGVVEFMQMLRKELGEDKLILGDGHSGRHNRAFSSNNGIESEGWPDLSDHTISDWSGGMNRHYFWNKNGHKPSFSYIAHKFQFQENGGVIPFSTHRLVFAAATFTDAAVAFGLSPQNEGSGLTALWDEFVLGVERKTGWLGKPLSPAVHLSDRSPDLLNGALTEISAKSLKHIQTHADTSCDVVTNQLICKSTGSKVSFVVKNVPVPEENISFNLIAHGLPMKHYAPEVARLVEFELLKPGVSLISKTLPRYGIRMHGDQEQEGIPEESGAKFNYKRIRIGDSAKDAYFLHPPGKSGKGYTWFSQDVTVPENGSLEFYTAMGRNSSRVGDGVWFRVLVAEVTEGNVAAYKEIFEYNQRSNEWVHHTLSLKDYSTNNVALKFVSDSGPNNNSAADQSFWGDINLRGPEDNKVGPEGTERYQYMSYVNESPFVSRFFFPMLNRDYADVRISIEGGESVTIDGLTAHSMPDVVYREFEHGIVLANPGLTPFTFNLDEIAPGRKFRHIQATRMQDTKVNNGEIVGSTVALPAKDAIFLSSVR